jgi:hypothetical protein
MSFEFTYNGVSYGDAIKSITPAEMQNRFKTYAVGHIAYRSENREHRKNTFTLEVILGTSADIEFNKIAHSEKAGENDSITYIRFSTQGSETIQATVIALQKPSPTKLLDKEGTEELNIRSYQIDVLLDDRQVERI